MASFREILEVSSRSFLWGWGDELDQRVRCGFWEESKADVHIVSTSRNLFYRRTQSRDPLEATTRLTPAEKALRKDNISVS